MKSIFPYLFVIAYITSFNAYSQSSTQVREYDLNQSEENAVYNFSFVHITDLHIGEGAGDYGTNGYLNDTMPQVDEGYPAVRLKNVVNWINANAIEKNIKFVVATGDITDSGERSEFEKAKEILDKLIVPYVPTIGNHDIWPYVRYQDEAPYAFGDSVMLEVFKETYDRARDFFDFWDDGTRLTRVYNPESSMEHYHQNFSFAYNGVGFLAFDFNPRYHVTKNEPGIGPEARLNDFPNGTFDWLINNLKNNPVKAKNNLILMTHQPPHNDILALFNGLTDADHKKMTNALAPYSDHLGLWLAGHVHRNTKYSLRAQGKKLIDVKETAANKEYNEGFLTLVNVYDVPTITSIKQNDLNTITKIFPNPSKDQISIQLLPHNKYHTIEIFNSLGVKIFEKRFSNENKIDLNIKNFDAGNYIIQFTSDEHIEYNHFIKY